MLMLLITDCRRKPGQYVCSGCDPERQRARRIQARTPFSKRALLHGGINIEKRKKKKLQPCQLIYLAERR